MDKYDMISVTSCAIIDWCAWFFFGGWGLATLMYCLLSWISYWRGKMVVNK